MLGAGAVAGLQEPKNEREAVAAVFAIARNVSVPFDAPYRGFGVYNTEFRTAINLTNKRFPRTDHPAECYLDGSPDV